MKYSSFALIFLISIFNFSCNEERCSCDPEINSLILSNKSEFAKMDRESLLDQDFNLQKPIFRIFSPEKKALMWNDKILTTIRTGNWNSQEVTHISELFELIDKKHYEDPSKISSDYIETINSWAVFGIENFGWSEARIRFLTKSLHDDEEKYLAEIESMKSKSSLNQFMSSARTASGEDCDCADPEGLVIEDCPYSDCDDSDPNCLFTLDGCGYFYVQECDGLCE